jgi:type IV pilus assembly protein PilZ
VQGDEDAVEPPAPQKRDNERKPIELKVEYQRLNAFFADYTKNISKGGTFIATENPLPIDTEFVFLLYVPNQKEPMRIAGRVKWIQTPDDVVGKRGQSPGMGIRFIYENAGEEELIARAVEQLMIESLGPRLSAKLMQAAKRAESEEDHGD